MLVINQIAENLTSSDQPIIQQIYNRDGKKLIAIGLKRDAIFPEHITNTKSKLLIIQGEVDFNTETKSYRLERFDSFNIPKEEKYTVVGFIDAIFLLFIGKPKA